MFTADSVDLFQKIQRLSGQGDQVLCSHFRTTMRILDALNGLSLRRDCPHGFFEVDLRPAGKAKLTGANEDKQGEPG